MLSLCALAAARPQFWSGKRVLIAGASSGLGAALATELSSRGALLALRPAVTGLIASSTTFGAIAGTLGSGPLAACRASGVARALTERREASPIELVKDSSTRPVAAAAREGERKHRAEPGRIGESSWQRQRAVSMSVPVRAHAVGASAFAVKLGAYSVTLHAWLRS